MTEQINQNPSIGDTAARLLVYIKPFLGFIFIAFFGFLLFALSQPAFAMLMESFVNALNGENIDDVYLIPLFCVVIAFMRGVGTYLGTYYMAKVSQNLIHKIRIELFQNIVQLPIGFFDQNKSGKLISLFTYNTGAMTTALTNATTTIVREGLTVIALFSYLFYSNAKLTLIFLLLGPPIAFVISWIGKRIKRLGRGIQSTMGEINHVASESFTGIRLIKSVGAENVVENNFGKVSDKTKSLSLKLAKASSIYTPVMQMLIVFAMAIVMYVVLITKDGMDSAALIAYVTAASLLPKPIRSLSSVHPQLLQGAVAAEQVFNHIDEAKEKDCGTISSGEIKGEICFDDIHFAYKENSPVLNSFSATIQPGETVALVGKSGGGKSTLVNLLPRFYEIQKGKISIDNRDIDEYTLNFLRKNIAIVSQQVVLFNGSIKDNICFGLSNVNESALHNAAKFANAHEFITELKDGYETEVGENGVMLSGGQRQRLAIAQAVLRDTPILILDEATSALDNESEARVQHALDKLMSNRTTLVIAHRLSTIENADKILVLDQGTVIEQGKHKQLIEAGGIYAQLVNKDFKHDAINS